jgi:hypothetical protein
MSDGSLAENETTSFDPLALGLIGSDANEQIL